MFGRLLNRKNKLNEIPLTLDQVYKVLEHFGDSEHFEDLKANFHFQTLYPGVGFKDKIPASDAIQYIKMNLKPPEGKSIDDIYIEATHAKYSEKTGTKRVIEVHLGNKRSVEGSEIKDKPHTKITIDYVVQN